MLTTQNPSFSFEALSHFVEYLRKGKQVDEERAVKAREHQILARLGDFGQHLVYRKAAAVREHPRRMPGGTLAVASRITLTPRRFSGLGLAGNYYNSRGRLTKDTKHRSTTNKSIDRKSVV